MYYLSPSRGRAGTEVRGTSTRADSEGRGADEESDEGAHVSLAAAPQHVRNVTNGYRHWILRRLGANFVWKQPLARV